MDNRVDDPDPPLQVIEGGSNRSLMTAAEAGLVAIRNGTSLFGVAIDRHARIGTIASGADIVWFVNLDDGEDTWGLPLSPAVERLLTRTEISLDDVARFSLFEFLAKCFEDGC